MTKAFILAAALLIAALSPAFAFDKGEVWQGTYSYRDGRTPVQFTLFITSAAGGRFEGTIVEPNTFGNRAAPELFADIDGNQKGRSFSFNKRYDGTGNQVHGVAYSGEIVGTDGRRAHGSWQLKPDSGEFEMHRR